MNTSPWLHYTQRTMAAIHFLSITFFRNGSESAESYKSNKESQVSEYRLESSITFTCLTYVKTLFRQKFFRDAMICCCLQHYICTLSRHIQVLIKVCTVAFLIQKSDFSVSLVMFHIAEEQMLVANRFCIWQIWNSTFEFSLFKMKFTSE